MVWNKNKQNKYNKKYRNEHKEEIKKYKKEYYKLHIKEIKQKQKKYNISHKKQIQKYNKQHYQENKEKIKKQCKEYYKKNKEICLKKKRKYVKWFYENNKEKYLKQQKKYLKSQKGKNSINKRIARRKRKLNWIKMFDNPFDESEIINWHHINDCYVVAIPKDLHQMYGGKNHRENIMTIVKQIYLGEGD